MAVANHPTHPEVSLLDGKWYSTQPHEIWTWMRQEAPVYYDEGADVWAIMRHADVLAIEKDPKTYSSALGAPRPKQVPLPMMISLDDPEHLMRRKLVNKGFTPQQVREKEEEIRGVCDEIIDRVCEKGECDFVWDIAAPLPLILIGDMLGFPRESYDDLLKWSDDLIRGTTATDPKASETAQAAALEFREFQMEVIEDRRSKPPCADLVSILCHSEVDGHKLDNESLVQETLLILIGGDETTRHVITDGMLAVMDNPDQRAKMAANLKNDEFMVCAVEEILRWVTPIKNMSRTLTKTMEINGQQLDEGEDLILMYPSANRDEAVFNDPFKFDLERQPNNHLSFGFGTHFCLGASLARLELKIMFEKVMERLPDVELAVDHSELPYRASNFIVGPEAMPVKFTPTAKVGS